MPYIKGLASEICHSLEIPLLMLLVLFMVFDPEDSPYQLLLPLPVLRLLFIQHFLLTKDSLHYSVLNMHIISILSLKFIPQSSLQGKIM